MQLVKPLTLLILPFAQLLHLDNPMCKNLPALQGTQVVEPCVLTVPAVHTVHFEEPECEDQRPA